MQICLTIKDIIIDIIAILTDIILKSKKNILIKDAKETENKIFANNLIEFIITP